jgi:hypothetical protein
MEYAYDSNITVTHLFTYDSLKRLHYVVDTYFYDSTQLVYEGNTSKISNLILRSGQSIRNIEYFYDSDNKVTKVIGPDSKAELMYRGKNLDSAILYMAPGVFTPDWEVFRYYKFVSDPNNSITSYHANKADHGGDGSFKYSSIKNPLKHLALLDFKGRLRMTDIFPLNDFGYAGEYLLERYRDKGIAPLPDQPVTHDYKCEYEFDENDNLVSSAVSIFDDGALYKVERRRYFYDCQ